MSELCGYSITDDTLDVACDWHANEGGRRIHDAKAALADHIAGEQARIDAAVEARLAPIRALADEWERGEAYACRNAGECVRCVSFQRAVIRLRAALRDATHTDTP